MCNESDCFTCPHHDCVSDEPPAVDLDCYMQFGLDRFVAGDSPEFDVPEVEVVPEKGLERLMSDDLRQFCLEKGVNPRVAADVEILRRAHDLNYTGRKLEKALYKVRHREKVAASKKRTRLRAKAKKR